MRQILVVSCFVQVPNIINDLLADILVMSCATQEKLNSHLIASAFSLNVPKLAAYPRESEIKLTPICESQFISRIVNINIVDTKLL